MTPEMTPAELRAARFMKGKRYAIPSEIGYAICEDRSKRGAGGMVPQGAGRLGGSVASRLVRKGFAEHSTERNGFAAYRLTKAGEDAIRRAGQPTPHLAGAAP